MNGDEIYNFHVIYDEIAQMRAATLATSDQKQTSKNSLVQMAADIAAAYVGNNKVALDQVGQLISTIHQSLAQTADVIRTQTGKQPIVSIKKSVTPDYIVCLEDGRKLKMLRRHLANAYGLTPEAYRVKWGLPADYPMTAPNYSVTRSRMAKKFGLGRKRRRK